MRRKKEVLKDGTIKQTFWVSKKEINFINNDKMLKNMPEILTSIISIQYFLGIIKEAKKK